MQQPVNAHVSAWEVEREENIPRFAVMNETFPPFFSRMNVILFPQEIKYKVFSKNKYGKRYMSVLF